MHYNSVYQRDWVYIKHKNVNECKLIFITFYTYFTPLYHVIEDTANQDTEKVL